MFLRIKAFAEYNIKILIKDKLSFIWSVTIPTIVLLLSYNNISDPNELRFWWTYMIITPFLFGVGIYALTLKELGVMRTIFSIKKDNVSFFLGNLLTQIIYSFICLFIFNLIASILLKFNFIYLMINSIKLIIFCIPWAFLGYNLTLLNKVHANTVKTIANMIIFGLFILMGTSSGLNLYNPLVLIADTIVITDINTKISFVIISFIMIIISIPSILKYECLSNERR